MLSGRGAGMAVCVLCADNPRTDVAELVRLFAPTEGQMRSGEPFYGLVPCKWKDGLEYWMCPDCIEKCRPFSEDSR
jgi:hypothetical protein